MLRHKRYVYGSDDAYVPIHTHFGQEMMNKMMEYNDMVALINSDTNEQLTFLELAQQTANIAVSLNRIGIRKGDVIGVCSEKRNEVMPTILGVICAGAVYSPVDVTFGAEPLLHRVKIAKPKIMFCSPTAYKLYKETFDTVGCIEKLVIYNNLTERMEKQDGDVLFTDFMKENVNLEDFMAVPVEGWKDYLFILFSSGTTGLPKGIPWTHVAFLINSLCYCNKSYKNSCLLNTREWYYTYGLTYTLGCLRGGATIVYSSKNEATDWLKAIEKYKIKILQLTPVSINALIKSSLIDQFDVSSVEMIISASTPIMADKVDAAKKRLPSLKNVYQLYGTTEAGGTAFELHAKYGARSGSVGVPSPGFVFKVVDLDTEEILGANQRGEIRFKSPSLTPGYLGIEDRYYIDAEGFFKTGDVGYYDDDGYFYIVNRIKELIKYNDYAVAPAELEGVLEQHPAVREAGVAGLPSETSGELPVAAVVLADGAPRVTRRELVDYVNQRIKILQLTPVSINALIKSSLIDQFDVSSVEMIISASTPIMADKVDAAKKRLPSLKNVYQLYGTTEAGGTAFELHAKYGARSGSVGVPSPGFVFKVVDLDTEEILGANQRGEIRFKSPSLTPGYLGIEDRYYIDAEGFFKTGDVGYYDDDGYFYIVNRIKELIKYNDYAVAPAELEGVLEQHPAVREAGVAGLPSETSGELPVAAVVLADGAPRVTRRELVDYVNQRITYRMRLAGVCFVDKLPRGAGAKLDRRALKDMLLNIDIGDE